MRNGIVCVVFLAVILCVALAAVDFYEGLGLDLGRHPVLRSLMMAVYSVIILSFLALMGVILWRGLRRERTRK